jgi:hypothetical protein
MTSDRRILIDKRHLDDGIEVFGARARDGWPSLGLPAPVVQGAKPLPASD